MTDAEAREMARELVRGSIAEDAVSQFIAQIIKHTYDERVRPLRRQVANLESKLAKAVEEAEKYQRAFAAQSRKLQAVLHIEGVRATLAEIKGESHD